MLLKWRRHARCLPPSGDDDWSARRRHVVRPWSDRIGSHAPHHGGQGPSTPCCSPARVCFGRNCHTCKLVRILFRRSVARGSSGSGRVGAVPPAADATSRRLVASPGTQVVRDPAVAGPQVSAGSLYDFRRAGGTCGAWVRPDRSTRIHGCAGAEARAVKPLAAPGRTDSSDGRLNNLG